MKSGSLDRELGVAWLSRLHQDCAQALYVHLPFCVRKCAYCDFASWETSKGEPLIEQYVRALEERVTEASEVGLLPRCTTAYVGGGTPTMLGASLLGGLVRTLRGACPDLSELTCEANPDSLSDEVLEALRDAGATRLSIGVQSLVDEELEALGRLHDAAAAVDRVSAAVSGGLDVSADLMCATPRQTKASWQHTLEAVLSLGVGHVSVYPLQIEDGTPLARMVGEEDPLWNAPEVQASRMDQARGVLEAAGFSRYEVASYALPGKACVHNQAYWTALPYLGIGTGASSMLTREGYARLRTLCARLPELPDRIERVRLTMTSSRDEFARASGFDGLSYDIEYLDAGQAAAEDLMLGMRMSSGVNPGLLEHAKLVLGERQVDDAITKVVGRGLAAWEHGKLVPTHDGWLLGNELYGEFWGLAVGDVHTQHLDA